MNLTQDEVQSFLKKVKPEIVYQGETFTVAKAAVSINRKRKITGEGIARLSSKDKMNPEIGKNIAISRATKALVKKLIRKRQTVHHPFMGQIMTKISLTYSRTVNLGNYESERLEMGIEIDLPPNIPTREGFDNLWKEIQSEVMKKLEVKPKGPYKPGSVIGKGK